MLAAMREIAEHLRYVVDLRSRSSAPPTGAVISLQRRGSPKEPRVTILTTSEYLHESMIA
jgi:hypothetical protein